MKSVTLDLAEVAPLLAGLFAGAGYEAVIVVRRADGGDMKEHDRSSVLGLTAGARANDNGPPAALPAND